ncbi:hypothetical protein FPV67DRAFT_1676458 [Lyophyllum atratum]|nr:hypothetical protein FPV67DRAFT_1676458 [Lyophyllum atratum]
MAAFTIVEARLISLFAENVVVGLYLITCHHTVIALFFAGSRWKRLKELNHHMITVAMLMFLNVTLSSATSVTIVWRAFVTAPPGTALESMSTISHWDIVLDSITLLTQTTIGDAMLVYRCWIVYACSFRVVAFSIILWVIGTTCSILLVYFETTLRWGAASASKLYPFGVAFWASTVALNVITTTLLVWPIWKAARHHHEFAYHSTTSYRPNAMKHVMRVIIDSGLLYTVAAFMTFITYTSKDNSLYVVSATEVPIAGIAFNLIIIRTAKATESDTIFSVSLPLHFMPPGDTLATVDDKGHGTSEQQGSS